MGSSESRLCPNLKETGASADAVTTVTPLTARTRFLPARARSATRSRPVALESHLNLKSPGVPAYFSPAVQVNLDLVVRLLPTPACCWIRELKQ